MTPLFRLTGLTGLIGLITIVLVCNPTTTRAQTQTGHSFEIVHDENLPIAVNRGGARFAGELFTYTEILTINSEDQRKRRRPLLPSAFLRGPDGRYYVVDSARERRTIYVYDSEGRYLDSFGEAGEKPGEFDTPVLQTIQGDTLLIFDGGLDRLTWLNTDGTLLDTLTVTRYRFPWQYQGDDGEYVQPYRAQAEREEAYRTQVTYPTEAWRLTDGRALVLETSEWPRVQALSRATVYAAGGDTLSAFGTREIKTGTWGYFDQPMRMPVGMPGRGTARGGRSGGGRPGGDRTAEDRSGTAPSRRAPTIRYKTTIFLPFAPLPMARYVPGRGILLSTGLEPRLTWHDLDGDPIRQIRFEAEPAEVSASDRENFETGYQQYLAGLEPGQRMAAEGRKRYQLLPRTKTFWTWVHLDDAGYYWLRRNEEYLWKDGNVSHTYWLLSPDGEFLGTTTAPPDFHTRELWQEWVTPVAVSDGHFLTITTGAEEGDWTLTVYRMEPSVPGFVYP